jgi:hypothetical protein
MRFESADRDINKSACSPRLGGTSRRRINAPRANRTRNESITNRERNPLLNRGEDAVDSGLSDPEQRVQRLTREDLPLVRVALHSIAAPTPVLEAVGGREPPRKVPRRPRDRTHGACLCSGDVPLHHGEVLLAPRPRRGSGDVSSLRRGQCDVSAF